MTRKQLGDLLFLEIVSEPKDVEQKGCWFIKGRDWSSYTTLSRKRAHRLVYEICNGPLREGQEICHRCDRKGCINPEHLFQGTHSDNMQDAFRKRRAYSVWPKGMSSSERELRERARWMELVRFCK